MDTSTRTALARETALRDDSTAPNGQANASTPIQGVLSEKTLEQFASRAAVYDRENRFFQEDFDELRASKYVLLPLPAEFGGGGMSLAQVSREQRRLAYYAPATALAVNRAKRARPPAVSPRPPPQQPGR